MAATPAAKPSEAPINVGAQQVATIYAKAFLGAAQKGGSQAGVNVDALVAEFDQLLSEVLNRHPEFEKLLGSAMVPLDDRIGILDRVLGSGVSPTFLNFLKVVARHGRLDLVRAIHREVHKQLDVLKGRLRVRVSTAAPIDPAVTQSILTSLRAMLHGEPVLETHEDPELIGGVVLRVGDTVFDGSVARQLQQLREQMIDRSVHEIQSGRDRFRNTG